MRAFFKFFINLSLSCLFLLASNSYAMHTHHCGGRAVESSLMTKAEGCGMELHPGANHKPNGFNALPCCSDIVSQITSGIQSFSKTDRVEVGFVPDFYPLDYCGLIPPKIFNIKGLLVRYWDPPNQNSFRSPFPALIQVFII